MRMKIFQFTKYPWQKHHAKHICQHNFQMLHLKTHSMRNWRGCVATSGSKLCALFYPACLCGSVNAIVFHEYHHFRRHERALTPGNITTSLRLFGNVPWTISYNFQMHLIVVFCLFLFCFAQSKRSNFIQANTLDTGGFN